MLAKDWGHQTNSSTPWHCILYQCVLDAEIPGCRVVGLCCDSQRDEASALHVDTCNFPGSKNFAVGLGSYTGGELFVEAPGGSVPFHDNATGEWLWGEKHALNLEPCTFDGFARHATLPWEGDIRPSPKATCLPSTNRCCCRVGFLCRGVSRTP